MCQGLVLLFDSTSYKQTHCTKLPGNQAASLLLNGTAVKKYIKKHSRSLSRNKSIRDLVVQLYQVPIDKEGAEKLMAKLNSN